MKQSPRRREWLTAGTLLACMLVVGFWQLMSQRSRRPFEPFDITGADLASFRPDVAGWQLTPLPINPDPIEPNVLAFMAAPAEPAADAAGRAFIVRLVHGYNMPDCMRIKGYTVELIADTRDRLAPGAPTPPHADTSSPLPPGLQLWRLAEAGRVSLWVTSMLQAGDFSLTAVDTRSMKYPKIGVPDNPGWFPQGLTLRSLRHPVRNLRLFLRAKWNAAHCDVLAFLNLRRSAWVSDQLLTLTASTGGPLPAGDDPQVQARVVALHQTVQGQLQEWRRQTRSGEQSRQE